jgi:hypothetical protein
MSTVRQRCTRCKPSAVDDADDLTYTTLVRARFYCAFCRWRRATVASLLVPESYGGERSSWNLRATCERCGELRHKIDGSDPTPPDPEGLRRLLNIPWVRPRALEILWLAATAKFRRGRSYNAADEAGNLGATVRDRITGWPGKERSRPPGTSDEDWAWLRSIEAYEALARAIYALLPADEA